MTPLKVYALCSEFFEQPTRIAAKVDKHLGPFLHLINRFAIIIIIIATRINTSVPYTDGDFGRTLYIAIVEMK